MVLAKSAGEMYAERRRGMRSTLPHAPIQDSAETYLYKRFKAAKIGRGLFQGKPKAYSGITKS